MLKKKFLAILLFSIIAICAISAVNAEENITQQEIIGENIEVSEINTAEETVDETLTDELTEDKISASDESENTDIHDTPVLTSTEKETLSENEKMYVDVEFYKQTGKYYKDKKIYFKVTDSDTGETICDQHMQLNLYDYTTNKFLLDYLVRTDSNGVGILDWKNDVSIYQAGTYTLKIEMNGDISTWNNLQNKYFTVISNTATTKVTINKFKVTLKAKALKTTYKSYSRFKIKVIGQDKKPVKYAIIKLKIYTGKKYKTVRLIANAKGIATYEVSKLSPGKHKVKIILDKKSSYINNHGFYAKTVTSYIQIQKRVKITVEREKREIGSAITVCVKDKTTKKLTNGIKVTLKIYTGSKYKTVKLVTGYDSDTKKKGSVGYGTNMLSVGTHKVKIIVDTDKYKGSATSKLVIKSSAKKYIKWVVKLSKGKTTFKTY